MGLNTGVLLNAALMGTAAWHGGKRTGKRSKLEEELALADQVRKGELHSSSIAENASQATAAGELARLRRDQLEHPERHRSTPAVPEYSAYSAYFDSQIAQGKTPEQADAAARARFGKAAARESGPVRGTPEYNEMLNTELSIRDKHERPAASRAAGEAGSAKALTDRREFMQSRITHWIDEGLSSGEAQRRAETEYRGSMYSANAVTKPTTKSLLAGTIPAGSTSPNVGAVRPATDADIDAAIDAVGTDPAKVKKWLAKKGLTP